MQRESVKMRDIRWQLFAIAAAAYVYRGERYPQKFIMRANISRARRRDKCKSVPSAADAIHSAAYRAVPTNRRMCLRIGRYGSVSNGEVRRPRATTAWI